MRNGATTRAGSSARNWPDPEQRALLGDLIADNSGATARLHAWAERTCPPVERTMRALLPAIHLRLEAAGLAVAWLADHHRVVAEKTERAIQAGLETADLLRQAGIPAVLVKGVPLGLFYYREASARPMADADLILPPAELLRADEIFRARGWRRKLDPPPATLPFLRALDYAHPSPASLDVQRYPFLVSSPASAVRRFQARSIEREVRGWRVLLPDATTMLLLACLHGRKPEASVARWPLDAQAILEQPGIVDEPIDWDALVSLAIDARIVSPVRDALAYLGEDLGLAVPADVRANLARLSPSPADRRQYSRLTRRPHEWSVRDVVATRWDEYAAVRPHDPRGFPAYFVAANAHYRGRSLTRADLWTRVVAEWSRAQVRIGKLVKKK